MRRSFEITCGLNAAGTEIHSISDAAQAVLNWMQSLPAKDLPFTTSTIVAVAGEVIHTWQLGGFKTSGEHKPVVILRGEIEEPLKLG